MSDISGPKTKTTIWQHFTRKQNYIACCNICKNNYSYRTTLSNLRKHWRQKHMGANDTDESDDDASNNSNDFDKKMSDDESDSQSTWNYFEVLDSDQFVARCKICAKDIAYDSVNELTQHARGHNVMVSDDEEWLDSKEKSIVKKLRINRTNASAVWRFMKVLDVGARSAMCLICNKKLSFMSSTSNLKKHVLKAHPHIDIHDESLETTINDKKLIISTDGKLYEIATSEGEKDPIQTDEIYLEESLDSNILEHIKEASPIRKKTKTHKRKSISQEHYQTEYSSIDLVKNSSNNTLKTTKTDSLDKFGEYVTSLLKELPKNVSDQLQSDIIKHIFTAKMALEPKYSVSIVDSEPLPLVISNSPCSASEVTGPNTSDLKTENANIISTIYVKNGSK